MAVLQRKTENKEEKTLQHRASLTVECAFVLPFFFLAVVILAGMLDLFRISMLIQSALCEGAKELGMYAYCGEQEEQSPVGGVNNGICTAYGMKKVREILKEETLSGVTGGINGILLTGSGYDGGIITLKAGFWYQSPVAFFRFFPVKIEVVGNARAWIGYQGERYGEQEDQELVYVTDWESVYHESEECSHLSLTVSRVSFSGLESRRNIYGERYHRCERCMENEDNDWIYITQSGSRYHSRADCSGLTRHVSVMKKSETGNLRPCVRCKGE